MKKLEEKDIRRRIKELEAKIEQADAQIQQVARIKISMQGGIIELRRLLKEKDESNKNRR